MNKKYSYHYNGNYDYSYNYDYVYFDLLSPDTSDAFLSPQNLFLVPFF